MLQIYQIQSKKLKIWNKQEKTSSREKNSFTGLGNLMLFTVSGARPNLEYYLK